MAFVLQDTDGCEHTEIFDKEKVTIVIECCTYQFCYSESWLKVLRGLLVEQARNSKIRCSIVEQLYWFINQPPVGE